MVERYLLDTGFVVALVDENDRDHQRCKEAWQSVRGEIHSVEGVLVDRLLLLGTRVRWP